MFARNTAEGLNNLLLYPPFPFFCHCLTYKHHFHSDLSQMCKWLQSCCFLPKWISLTLLPLSSRCPDTERLRITSSWGSKSLSVDLGSSPQSDTGALNMYENTACIYGCFPTLSVISLIMSRGSHNLILQQCFKQGSFLKVGIFLYIGHLLEIYSCC